MRFRFNREEFPEKSFDEDEQVGFLAQEVEKEIPEVVKTDADGWKTVAYGSFAPYLVEAIKEQDKVIEELLARVAALTERDAKVKELERKHAALQNEVAELKSLLASVLQAQ